ncbi:MAG: archaeal proteasome endopeptidase complex subunit beta [Candidatus Marsarchaeota archaeon]|jgi:proteasome beta subunit|nr:archaeal proteasome endopeptidase complex subunit beta [Candidatus Marsarchaeota archaeon]
MDIDMKARMKGTTTVGLICSDGVVLASDSRATADTYIASSDAKKVWKIDDNIGMTIAGGVGDAQELVRIMRVQNEIYKMNEGRPLSPKSANSLFSIILNDNKWAPYYVQLIVGGIDADGNPGLYSLDPFGGYSDEKTFTSTGSGSPVAMGVLEVNYKKNINVKEGMKLAAKAIATAMKRDSATGDNIMVVTITERGYSEYTGKEVEKALSEK